MGKKDSALPNVKVGPPTQSRKQLDSATSKTSPRPVKPSKLSASETATATVERVFGGARNKFISRIQAGAPALGADATASAAGPSSSTRDTPSPSMSAPSDTDNDSEDDGDSKSESAGLNDVDGHAFDGLGSESDSESESETDAEAPVAPTPRHVDAPSTKSKGKQKERKVSAGLSSKAKAKATSPKPKANRNVARFGMIVFVPIVPVVPPGSINPNLPLPTPHESNNLRRAGLAATPPPPETTFGISDTATNREVKRFFREILPKPFETIGKKASFHLLYSHGRTLGGCGTDSPRGADISISYRSGKANNLKVLYLAPAEPISEAVIEAWKVKAIVDSIRARMQGKKRKRSSRDESESEDEAEESGSVDEDESEAGDSESVGTGVDISGEDDNADTTTPPRKKIKLDREVLPSIVSPSTSSPAPTTTVTHDPTKTAQASSSRVLRDRNRVSGSAPNSKSKAKVNDPLNPWQNPLGYVL